MTYKIVLTFNGFSKKRGRSKKPKTLKIKSKRPLAIQPILEIKSRNDARKLKNIYENQLSELKKEGDLKAIKDQETLLTILNKIVPKLEMKQEPKLLITEEKIPEPPEISNISDLGVSHKKEQLKERKQKEQIVLKKEQKSLQEQINEDLRQKFKEMEAKKELEKMEESQILSDINIVKMPHTKMTPPEIRTKMRNYEKDKKFMSDIQLEKLYPDPFLTDLRKDLNLIEETEGRGKGLTNFEINDFMKDQKEYLGTFPMDLVPFDDIPIKSISGFILNLDTSGMPGSHWVAIYIDPINEKEINYYDPFGQEPPKLFMDSIKKFVNKLPTMIKLKINSVKTQDNNSDSCGWLSILFLLKRFRDKLSFRESTGFIEPKKDLSPEFENQIIDMKKIIFNLI